jgi:hypothetical protein
VSDDIKEKEAEAQAAAKIASLTQKAQMLSQVAE